MADATPTLNVSDILSRTHRLEWPEAVALSRAVFAEVAIIGGGSRTSFPTLDEIHLSRAGELTFTGTSFGAEGGQWAGSVLQALLTNADPPVQLRLLVAQASSDSTNLAQIDEALAYFERPNRAGVLQNLYGRAIAAAANALIAPPTLKKAEPAPKPESPKRAAQKAAWSRRAKVAAVVLVSATAGGAAAWYLIVQRPQFAAAGSEATTQIADKVGDAFLAGVSKITETAGLGRVVSPEDVSPEAAAAPQPADIQLAPSRRRPAPPAPASSEPPPAFVEFTAYDLAADPDLALVPPPGDPAAEPTIDVPDAPDAVYSADSADVAPPVGIRPQLARALPPAVLPIELTAVELIIAPNGSVETARLVSAPKTVLDSMIVSAAKAWEFEPAIRNGKAVKYRKTVWIRAR